MTGYGLRDNDGIPLTTDSEQRIAEDAPAAVANLLRRGQATGDVLTMLGLDWWVA